MNKLIPSGFAIVSVAAAFYLTSSDQQAEQAKIVEPATPAHPTSADFPQAHAAKSLAASLGSPFGRGAPPSQRSVEQRAQERKLVMEKNHYSTPAAYFTMSLKELQARARQNDVFALLQLGQQYWAESEEIATDPSYDKATSPQNTAISMMSAAATQGHSHAATITASMYESQGQGLQAYAWMLISEQMGDLSLQEQRKSYESRLTNVQRDEAAGLASTTGRQIQSNVWEILKNKSGTR
jgi:hypothetical protein